MPEIYILLALGKANFGRQGTCVCVSDLCVSITPISQFLIFLKYELMMNVLKSCIVHVTHR